MITQKQLTLADIFEDCQEIFESDKPQFLTLLENHIDLDKIVRSIDFYNKDYLDSHPDIIVEKNQNLLMKINLLLIQKH